MAPLSYLKNKSKRRTLKMILHPTAMVIDSTKIYTWQTCKRRFFYNYILGWKWDLPEIHLFFGECFHLGMEHLMKEGLSDENAAIAFLKFMERWREEYGPEQDNENAPKTPENAQRIYQEYVDNYEHLDTFKVLYTEVAGSVPISHDDLSRKIHFKMDAVCIDPEYGYFALDHKTAKYFDRNFNRSFEMSPQTDAYCHAMHWAFQDDGPIFGMIINAIAIQEAVKYKKDGTPYANQADRETFRRVLIQKNLSYLNRWLVNINQDYDDIEQNLDALTHQTLKSDTMNCFNCSTASCITKYGACPYFDICKVFHNPLRHADDPPPMYKVEFWDPRDQKEKAGKVIEL